MTDVRTENIKLCLEKIVRVKPGQNLLVIAQDYARSMSLARKFMDLANSMGIEAVLATMQPHTRQAQEPPRTIAAAMKEADVIVEVTDWYDIAHTDARKEATELGRKFCIMLAEVYEDRLKNPISMEGLNKVKERTDNLVEIATRANVARVTTPYGTDVTMSLKGRQGIPLHPLTDSGLPVIRYYAEVAIAPVEGTTEGVIVVDAGVQGWEYLLRKPIRFEVKKGRIQLETVSSDDAEDEERFKRMISFDQDANNCAAELGLQTSHILPKILLGGMLDYGSEGKIHIAYGRNNDIGGETWSQIHQDCLMTQPTVKLDDICVIENGELKI